MTGLFPMRSIPLAGLLLLLAIAGSAPSLAGALDDAKRAGEVGERFDGYLGAVAPEPSEATRRLVDDINARRRAKYREVATSNGIRVEEVARISGEKLVRRAAPGQFVMLPDGRWTRK